MLFLILAHVTVLFAGFVSPYSGEGQNRDLSFAPPTAIHTRDKEGRFCRPFVYGLRLKQGSVDAYEEDESARFPVRFFVDGEEYKFLGIIRGSRHLIGTDAPGRVFLLGTDRYGRDLLSRFAHGGELSLIAGISATMLTLSIATLLGGVAGFAAGWVDRLIMAFSNLFLALPWLYLLLIVRAAMPLNLSPAVTLFLLIGVIGVVGWAKPARIVRGIVLEAKSRPFVEAARSMGGSPWYLLATHVIPQAYGLLLTQAVLLVPQYVLAEVTLSFVGLGIGEPSASWGTMLAELQQLSVLQNYWWMVLPALLMLPTFASYFVLASHLQARLESRVS